SSSSSSSPSAAWSISIATSCFASSSEPSSSSGLSLSHSNSVMGTPRTLAMIATSESSPAFASFTNSSSVATMALSRSSVRFFTTSMTGFFSLASDIFFLLRTLHESEIFTPRATVCLGVFQLGKFRAGDVRLRDAVVLVVLLDGGLAFDEHAFVEFPRLVAAREPRELPPVLVSESDDCGFSVRAVNHANAHDFEFQIVASPDNTEGLVQCGFRFALFFLQEVHLTQVAGHS